MTCRVTSHVMRWHRTAAPAKLAAQPAPLKTAQRRQWRRRHWPGIRSDGKPSPAAGMLQPAKLRGGASVEVESQVCSRQAANWAVVASKRSSACRKRSAEGSRHRSAASVAARQARHPLRLSLERSPQGGELCLHVVDAFHQCTLRRVLTVVHSLAPSSCLDLLFRGVAARTP